MNHMKNYGLSIENLLQEEDGVTAIEYAVLLTLLVVIWIGALAAIGTGMN